MKQFFKKDCIYQKNPAIYLTYANTGLGAYGIDTTCCFSNVFYDYKKIYPELKPAW